MEDEMDSTSANFASQVARDLPPSTKQGELTPRQLAELRRTIPAFAELEGKTLRSRGVNTWWLK
jgi:hypothetical protein